MFKQLITIVAVIGFMTSALAQKGPRDVRDTNTRDAAKMEAQAKVDSVKAKLGAKEVAKLNEDLRKTKMTADTFLLIEDASVRARILKLAEVNRNNPHPNHETMLNNITSLLEVAKERTAVEREQIIEFIDQAQVINKIGSERNASTAEKASGVKARKTIADFTEALTRGRSVEDASLEAITKNFEELTTESARKEKRDQFLAACTKKS